MAKNKVSEWDGENPANNTDVGGISIAEGCPPSNINNAIRMTMTQVKAWQDGASGDPTTIDGLLTVSGDADFTGVVTAVTPDADDNSTKVATTEYVDRVTGALGTMGDQDADNVAITGGVINGETKTGQDDLIVMADIGTNSYGKKTVSSLSPSGGVDGDVWYKV
jgi:hypothetical protein